MKTTKERDFSRILSIDIARGLAVFGMIMVHTLWMYADKSTQFESYFGKFIHFIGQEAAIFLILMGFSMVLSSQYSFRIYLKRSIYLIAAGYLLNTLKFIVPIAVFGTMPDSFIQAYGWESPLTTSQYVYLLLTGDILQLAGLSLMLIALLKSLTNNRWIILATSIGILLASAETRGFRVGDPVIDYFFDLMWGEAYNVYFPVFPWSAFILFGLYFGMQWRSDNSDFTLLFRKTLPLAIVLFLSGAILVFAQPEYHFNDFFHHGIGGAFLMLGLNWLIFFCIHQFMGQCRENFFVHFLIYLSRRVTTLYVIQWTLICWGMSIIGYQTLNAAETWVMMCIQLLLTLLVQYCLDNRKKVLLIRNMMGLKTVNEK